MTCRVRIPDHAGDFFAREDLGEPNYELVTCRGQRHYGTYRQLDGKYSGLRNHTAACKNQRKVETATYPGDCMLF